MRSLRDIFIIVFFVLPFAVCAYSGFRNSVYDYQNNVIDFSDEGIPENIVDGRAIAFSPLDLKVGDIFIDADGNALKVYSITTNPDGSMDIETIKPDIREVFQYIDIPNQTIDVLADDFIIYGEDATEEWNNGIYDMVYDEDGNFIEDPASRSGATCGGMLGDIFKETTICPRVSIPIKLNKKEGGKGFYEELKSELKDISDHYSDGFEATKSKLEEKKGGFTEKDTLTISVEFPYKQRTLSLTGNVDLPYVTVITRKKTWKFWKKSFWSKENLYHKGSARCELNADLQIGSSVTFALAGAFSEKKLIGEVGPVRFYSWSSGTMAASFAYQKYNHLVYRGGVSCDLDGEYIRAVPHNFKAYTLDKYCGSGESMEASVIGTLSWMMGPETGLSVAGISLVSITGKVGAEAKIVVPVFKTLKFDDSRLNNYGEPSVTINDVPFDKDNLGTDWRKVSFNLYAKAMIDASCINDKVCTNLWTWKSDPLISLP